MSLKEFSEGDAPESLFKVPEGFKEVEARRVQQDLPWKPRRNACSRRSPARRKKRRKRKISSKTTPILRPSGWGRHDCAMLAQRDTFMRHVVLTLLLAALPPSADLTVRYSVEMTTGASLSPRAAAAIREAAGPAVTETHLSLSQRWVVHFQYGDFVILPRPFRPQTGDAEHRRSKRFCPKPLAPAESMADEAEEDPQTGHVRRIPRGPYQPGRNPASAKGYLAEGRRGCNEGGGQSTAPTQIPGFILAQCH